ncbi:MAG: beta-galactosidase [Lachnospiraceae bacterium]|nr:beta-galactosidase [Lachnospiraceae bacterium]
MEKKYDNLFWDTSLTIEERIQYLLGEMTLAEKFSFLSTRHPALERLGIPAFSFGGEAAHGVEARNDQGSGGEAFGTTSFSQPIGMSASWDTELIRQAGEVTGTEARALFNRNGDGGLSRWAPTIDMERDPRWGRTEEGYGEDPLLAGKMASAYIKGMQGTDDRYLRMAASVKHFYGNNVEEGRIWKSSSINPRNKYEYYLEPFRRAVTEGRAEGLMTAYNEINGVPAILNHEVKELVKEKWGLLGHVVCDGKDMTQTVQFHHYYKSHGETVAEALKAGADCFTDDPETVEKAVREAYENHLISEMDIDKALTNSFRTKFRLGLYDRDKNPYAGIGEGDLNTEKAADISRKMAQESGVLLKNTDNFLPLGRSDRIAVAGPVGDAWFQDWYGGQPPYRVTLRQGLKNLLGREIPFDNGLPWSKLRVGSRYVGLDGEQKLVLTTDAQRAVVLEVNDWGFGSTTLYVPSLKKYVSLHDEGYLKADKDAPFGWFVKESFRMEETDKGVRLYGWDGRGIAIGDSLRGKTSERMQDSANEKDRYLRAGEKEEAVCFVQELVRDGIREAAELAGHAEKVIVALGCNPMINSKEEIDRTDLILAPFQEKLVQEIYKVNPNIVLMLFTNYPYSINWEQEHLPAILQMATGSQEMGNAAADLLFGEVNPSGRLPLTWYRTVKELADMDDYDIIKGKRTYQYFEGEVLYPFGHGLSYTEFGYGNLQVRQSGDMLYVDMEVENTGDCRGDEVVQIYGKRLSPSRIRHPARRLIGFRRLKDIAPGEKRKVELEIPCMELAVYDVAGRRKIVEEGEYLVTAGDGKQQYRTFIKGDVVSVRDPVKRTAADHYDDYENAVLRHAGGGVSCVGVLRPEEKTVLIYRGFAWTGEETHLVMNLRSSQQGSIRVFLTEEEKGAEGHQAAESRAAGCREDTEKVLSWKGIRQEFSKVRLPVKRENLKGQAACEGTGKPLNMVENPKVFKELRIELQGGAELESFSFAAEKKTAYKSFSEKIKKIPYGGDYNPEQWPEEVWEEDMRLFKLAGIDCVTLNVFSWASLQPSEDTYCFDKLDRIMELVRKNNLQVILATSTAVHPAWMARKYPEVLRTNFEGMKRKFGDRHNSCPNSPIYRKYSSRLARKLAERYQGYDNIIAWHVSNEYGGECYCGNCERGFRKWLKEKYDSLKELNRVWNTSFWGHTFYDWEEVPVPNLLSEHFERERTTFQGISLDYKRFFSDSVLDCYKMEYQEIKAVTPEIPVTTNMMGFYKNLDYHKWARYLDFASWDNYPANEAPPSAAAMNHDLMRGLKQGAPFVLMEQTPSVTNWLAYNALKRPGVMRLWSYQALAHGSDSVLFFQMRRSIGACEKYHGAVIDHAGHEYTRVFREVKALGRELGRLGGETLGSRVKAQAAIVVDWDNWWALEYSAGPSCDLKYLDEVQRYYDAFFDKNIPVDIISVSDSLDGYSLVIAPVLYMVKEGYAQKIERFVEGGGCFVTTFFSGIVDEHDLVQPGGYPGQLRDVLGIWVEETDALPRNVKNSFRWGGRTYECELLCDILYTRKAQALAFYEKDFYAGAPVLTKNRYGGGSAYYVASRGDEDFYKDFVWKIAGEIGVRPLWEEIPGVEICARSKENMCFLFFLNHGERDVKVTALADGESLLEGRRYGAGEQFEIPAKGVAILKVNSSQIYSAL